MKFDCLNPVTPCCIVIIDKELYRRSDLKCIWIFVPKKSMYAFQMHVPLFGICHFLQTQILMQNSSHCAVRNCIVA